MTDGGDHLAHFWSLAIEEQFYLLWPLAFFLLRTGRRRLVFAAVLLIAAPFWKYLMYKLAGGAMNTNNWRFDLRYDALMAGCCLALLRHDRSLRWLAANHIVRSTPAALLALAAIGAGLAGLPVRAFSASLSFIGVAAFINFSVERRDGVIGAFLNCGPMIWIGQISYSLYLWQQVFCWNSRIPWLGEFPENIVVSVFAAMLSYYLLETPLTALRRRVPHLRNPSICSKAQPYAV